MTAAIVIGTIICIIAAMAGDTSQDLKTGYIVGATPVKQQVGELIGAVASAFAIGGVMYLLNSAWQFGSEQIPAPQASLMKMVVEGVVGDNMPWTLIFIGVFVAIVVEILKIPVLAFAIGLYLPIYLSAPIMVGGAVRWLIERRKYSSEKEKKHCTEMGTLYSAGMIAGEGIVGILLALVAVFNWKIDLSGIYGGDANFSGSLSSIGNWVGVVVFALLVSTVFFVCRKKKVVEVETQDIDVK